MASSRVGVAVLCAGILALAGCGATVSTGPELEDAPAVSPVSTQQHHHTPVPDQSSDAEQQLPAQPPSASADPVIPQAPSDQRGGDTTSGGWAAGQGDRDDGQPLVDAEQQPEGTEPQQQNRSGGQSAPSGEREARPEGRAGADAQSQEQPQGRAVPQAQHSEPEKRATTCGTAGLHPTGTTFFTDGSTGWTVRCMNQMLAAHGASGTTPEQDLDAAQPGPGV